MAGLKALEPGIAFLSAVAAAGAMDLFLWGSAERGRRMTRAFSIVGEASVAALMAGLKALEPASAF